MQTQTVKNRPATSVIIPTYNGWHLLERHLPAVIHALASHDELIIIDDASTQNPPEWYFNTTAFKTHFEKIYKNRYRKDPIFPASVQLLSNIQNLRFGATVNKAVRFATHDFIFLLNNDVEPEETTLSALHTVWLQQADPTQIFAIGCYEYEGADPKKATVGGKNKLWFERGLFVHARADSFVTGETAWASGGSALFSAKKWQLLGGFDRLFYPAYWEDIDLSLRAKQNGWQVLFAETARVYHLHETTHQTVFGTRKIERMSWKNAYRFTWRHMRGWQWAQHFVWLPYHLLVSGWRTNGVSLLAFFDAFSEVILDSNR